MTNEKRLEALAELQADGERMDKRAEEHNAWIEANRKAAFDLGYEQGLRDVVFIRCTKHHAHSILNRSEINNAECGYCAYEQGKIQGFNKALDLVMEEVDLKFVDYQIIEKNDLKAIIFKLRGER